MHSVNTTEGNPLGPTEWKDYLHERQTKQLFSGVEGSRSKKLVRHSWHNLSRLARLVTLNYHMSLTTPGSSPLCRFCGRAEETFHHFVLSCPCLLSLYHTGPSIFSLWIWQTRTRNIEWCLFGGEKKKQRRLNSGVCGDLYWNSPRWWPCWKPEARRTSFRRVPPEILGPSFWLVSRGFVGTWPKSGQASASHVGAPERDRWRRTEELFWISVLL